MWIFKMCCTHIEIQNSKPGTPLTKSVYKDDTYTVSVNVSECIRMIYFVNSHNYEPVELLICRYKNQNCTVSKVFGGSSNNYLETSIDGDHVIFTFRSGGVITLTSNIK